MLSIIVRKINIGYLSSAHYGRKTTKKLDSTVFMD